MNRGRSARERMVKLGKGGAIWGEGAGALCARAGEKGRVVPGVGRFLGN